MKKLLKLSAIVAAAAVIAGATGAAGCAASNKNLASLASNWYTDTSFGRIQPTFIEGNSTFSKECLEYTVTKVPAVLDGREISNATYSVDYAGGVYSTEFCAKNFDIASLTHSEFRDKYTEAAGGGGITAYYFKTELRFDGITYKCGDSTETIEDCYAVTEAYFLSVREYLRPLYSRKQFRYPFSVNLNAYSIADTYELVEGEYINYYSFDCDKVITEANTNNSSAASVTGEFTYDLGGNDSTFDSYQMPIVARGMGNLTSSLSQNIQIYAPADGQFGYTLKGGNAALSSNADKATAEKSALQTLLQDAGLFTPKEIEVDGEKKLSELETVSVSCNFNSGMTGVTPTYWFASILDGRNNAGRATMVKYSEPLPFNLGVLECVLTRVDSTLVT